MPAIVDRIIFFIVYAVLTLLCSFGVLGTFVPLLVKRLPHFILGLRRRRHLFEETYEEFPRRDRDEVQRYLGDEKFTTGAFWGASVTGFLIALVYYFFHLRGACFTDYLRSLLNP